MSNARCKRSSSEASKTRGNHHTRCDTRMYNRGIGTIPRCNAYGYCCAYSATIVRWLCTWGVAPGSKLLRFQRALDTWVLSVAIMASSLAVSPGRGAVFSVRVGYIGVVRGHHGIVPRHLPWPWGRTFGTRWPHGLARGHCGHAPCNPIATHDHSGRRFLPFYRFTLLPLKVGDYLYHYLVAL